MLQVDMYETVALLGNGENGQCGHSLESTGQMDSIV